MPLRTFFAAFVVLAALVGLAASASAAWRFADRSPLGVSALVEGHAGAGVAASWAATADFN